MNRATLKDKIPLIVYINIVEVAKLSCKLAVTLPRKIKSVNKTSPSIEIPVYSTDCFAVSYESRSSISCPRIIC